MGPGGSKGLANWLKGLIRAGRLIGFIKGCLSSEPIYVLTMLHISSVLQSVTKE